MLMLVYIYIYIYVCMYMYIDTDTYTLYLYMTKHFLFPENFKWPHGAYFLRKMQNLRVNNSKTLRIKNAKFPSYCFCKNTNI